MTITPGIAVENPFGSGAGTLGLLLRPKASETLHFLSCAHVCSAHWINVTACRRNPSAGERRVRAVPGGAVVAFGPTAPTVIGEVVRQSCLQRSPSVTVEDFAIARLTAIAEVLQDPLGGRPIAEFGKPCKLGAAPAIEAAPASFKGKLLMFGARTGPCTGTIIGSLGSTDLRISGIADNFNYENLIEYKPAKPTIGGDSGALVCAITSELGSVVTVVPIGIHIGKSPQNRSVFLSLAPLRAEGWRVSYG